MSNKLLVEEHEEIALRVQFVACAASYLSDLGEFMPECIEAEVAELTRHIRLIETALGVEFCLEYPKKKCCTINPYCK